MGQNHLVRKKRETGPDCRIDRGSGALYSGIMSETMSETVKTLQRDTFYMKRALRLAKKGRGKTSPNPMVGAVVVRGDAVSGEGYHHAAGEPHAEVLALAVAGARAKGATLYTTLEPCCHTKKRTGPCTDVIIQSGITRVVSAMKDPNPMVLGKGFEVLQQAGIEVVHGLLQTEATQLNEVFIKCMSTGMPFVTLKAAMTLDGRIATASGASKWISGEKARKEVDHLRAEANGVLVGIGTVRADDPMLNLRTIKGVHPMRIVIDPMLKIPLSSKLVTTALATPTLVLTTSKAAPERIGFLSTAGVTVTVLPEQNGAILFEDILNHLGKIGVTHLLIEGGAGVNGMALRSGLVDRIIVYISPRFLCGSDALGMVTGKAVPYLDAAVALEDVKVRRVGGDIRVTGRFRK